MMGLFVRGVAAFGAAIMVMAAALYILPKLWIDRGVVLLAAISAVVFAAVLRWMLYSIVDENLFKRRVLVYGAGDRAAAIARLRRRSDRRGFRVMGFIQCPGEYNELPSKHLVDARNGLTSLCRKNRIDEVVVAMDDRRRGFPATDLLECRFRGVEVTELSTFLERETGIVRMDVLNPSWMIFGSGFRRGAMRTVSTRILDLFTSSLLLLTTMPVMLATALAIKLEDGWQAPVFYRQQRVGLGGKTFGILKFRSMCLDAERNGARWAQRRDPRVTKVGGLIRMMRIDELPQIINVFRGDMSLVGPRPERPQFVDAFSKEIPYYVMRHCVKPGITGWAQLCYPYGSSKDDALQKLQYDLYYIKNKCILFDLTILLQTVEVVFLGVGAR
jgi:sugar transferase (PEP-CTERM system associated)